MSKSAAIGLFRTAFPAAFYQRSENDNAIEREDVSSPELSDAMQHAFDTAPSVVLHDFLVPIRQFDPMRPIRLRSGREKPATALDLAYMIRQRIMTTFSRLGSKQRATIVMCVDKSAYVPITKGIVQRDRRKAYQRSERALEDAKLPLVEVPDEESDDSYVYYTTELSSLGPWKEIMDDRLPAEVGTGEEFEYKVLSDGRRYKRHQGRRLEIIRSLFMWLLRPADEDNPEPEPNLESDDRVQATLVLKPGQKLLIDGADLRPEHFQRDARGSEDPAKGPYWLDGVAPPPPGLLNDPNVRWFDVPIVVWCNANETRLRMGFAIERANSIGEADLSMFWHANFEVQARAAEPKSIDAPLNVVLETSDTDITHLAMLFHLKQPRVNMFVRIPRRLTAEQLERVRIAEELGDEAETRAYPLYVIVPSLVHLLKERFVPTYGPTCIETLVTVLLTAGSDYTLNWYFVNHSQFWNAFCTQGAFICADGKEPLIEVHAPSAPESDRFNEPPRTRWSVSPKAWLRLIMAAYSVKHDSRLLSPEGKLLQSTIEDINVALAGTLAPPTRDADGVVIRPSAGFKRNRAGKEIKTGLGDEKHIPSKDDLRARLGTVRYVSSMFAQVGELAALQLPTSADELHSHGFTEEDVTRAMSRLNIKFIARVSEAAAAAEV